MISSFQLIHWFLWKGERLGSGQRYAEALDWHRPGDLSAAQVHRAQRSHRHHV